MDHLQVTVKIKVLYSIEIMEQNRTEQNRTEQNIHLFKLKHTILSFVILTIKQTYMNTMAMLLYLFTSTV